MISAITEQKWKLPGHYSDQYSMKDRCIFERIADRITDNSRFMSFDPYRRIDRIQYTFWNYPTNTRVRHKTTKITPVIMEPPKSS